MSKIKMQTNENNENNEINCSENLLGKYLLEKSEDYKNIGIFLHDSPDPDAMASGMALAQIGEKYGYNTFIYYGGEVTYTKNKAMIQILGINMIKIEELKQDEESLNRHKEFLSKAIISIVDTSCFQNGNCKGPSCIFEKEKIPNIIIDHHGQFPIGNDIIINKNYGSCSSIMMELLNEENIIPDKILSTALYYGIMSDTDDLNRVEITREQDVTYSDQLKSLIDFQYYLRIVNCKKPKSTLRLEGIAKYLFFKERGNCTVSGIGFIKPAQAGAISDIADNILSTYQEVENVIVIGITDDGIGKEKRIRASLRNSGDVLDSDDFMKKIFSKKYAGGRKGAAAANIPVDEILSLVIDDASENKEVQNTIFNYIFESYAEKILSEIQIST